MDTAVVFPTGCGFTEMVKVLTGPKHPFFVPVTLIVLTKGELVVLTAAVKLGMVAPLPEAARLVPVLSLVQLKVTPDPAFDPKAIAATVPPEHTVTLEIAFTIGVGLMVIVKLFAFAPALTHPLRVAITSITPTMSDPVLFAGAM